MNARVEWLPVGHIAHGYRRAFAIYEENRLRHMVVFVPMPYETVYQVKLAAGDAEMADPSLWWGLSIISNLIADGFLLAADNPETADDGFVQMRPQYGPEFRLIPLKIANQAVSEGGISVSLLMGR